MSQHCPECYDPVFLTDVVQISETTDVDDRPRLRQPELHRRNQAVATSQNLCILVARERSQSFVESSRPNVVESCWNHDRTPFERLMARHTFSGVSGKSR